MQWRLACHLRNFQKLVASLIQLDRVCFCRKQQIMTLSHQDDFCKNYGKYITGFGVEIIQVPDVDMSDNLSSWFF